MPCQRPNVPTNVATSASSSIPCRARTSVRAACVEACWVEQLCVDAVRVHDDPLLLDAALEQLVAKHVRDRDDDVGMPQQHLLGLQSEVLVAQRTAPMPRHPDL